MRNTADVTGGKPIAVLMQSVSDVSAINPLVAFYDIHGGKREMLFFYFVPDTTREPQIFLNKNMPIECTVCMPIEQHVTLYTYSSILAPMPLK
jgi:hypothetical protein